MRTPNNIESFIIDILNNDIKIDSIGESILVAIFQAAAIALKPSYPKIKEGGIVKASIIEDELISVPAGAKVISDVMARQIANSKSMIINSPPVLQIISKPDIA